MSAKPRIVVVGAGAIGSSIAGWIAPACENFHLLARGESLSVLKSQGLKSYLKGQRDVAVAFPVDTIESLTEIPPPDIIIITVKNYDLEATARDLRAQLGTDEPIIVGLQNGVLNQQILPQYFTNLIYGVASYNAWKDSPGEVGHEARGFITLGTLATDLGNEMQQVAQIFRLGLKCEITDRLQDAAHCKLVFNLANALMTLVGFQLRPIKKTRVLLRLTVKLFWEGIQLLQAAGYHEHSIGRMPKWKFIHLGAILPPFIMSALFRSNAKKVGLNSMSQDIYGGKITTELETLNGYMLALAHQVKFPTPINQTIYEVAKERFGPNFQPLSEEELWARVQQNIKISERKG